jgi:hypothetical protein
MMAVSKMHGLKRAVLTVGLFAASAGAGPDIFGSVETFTLSRRE